MNTVVPLSANRSAPAAPRSARHQVRPATGRRSVGPGARVERSVPCANRRAYASRTAAWRIRGSTRARGRPCFIREPPRARQQDRRLAHPGVHPRARKAVLHPRTAASARGTVGWRPSPAGALWAVDDAAAQRRARTYAPRGRPRSAPRCANARASRARVRHAAPTRRPRRRAISAGAAHLTRAGAAGRSPRTPRRRAQPTWHRRRCRSGSHRRGPQTQRRDRRRRRVRPRLRPPGRR